MGLQVMYFFTVYYYFYYITHTLLQHFKVLVICLNLFKQITQISKTLNSVLRQTSVALVLLDFIKRNSSYSNYIYKSTTGVGEIGVVHQVRSIFNPGYTFTWGAFEIYPGLVHTSDQLNQNLWGCGWSICIFKSSSRRF